MIRVVVGSKNPVKIKAVENVFRKVFGDVEVKGVEVNSGVSHTPSSWEEIAQGAINRARNALKKSEADFGVGLEGGYEKTRFGAFISDAVAIMSRGGEIGIGGGKKILLPNIVVEKLKLGQELGNIMDELQGMENTKQRWGAIGFFTRGHSNRQESFEQDVLFALVRFLRKELYP